jgi:hypothetical protein
MGGPYFPAMPDAKILPILSDAQRDVWRGLPKPTVRFGVSLPSNAAGDIGDEVWDDQPPKKPSPAGGKAAPEAKGTPKGGDQP